MHVLNKYLQDFFSTGFQSFFDQHDSELNYTLLSVEKVLKSFEFAEHCRNPVTEMCVSFLGNHGTDPSVYSHWAFMEYNNALCRLGAVLFW